MKRLIFILFFCSSVVFWGREIVFAQMMGLEDMAPANKAVTTEEGLCPITGAEGKAKNSHTYKGETYYFCCQMCLERFKHEPERYISRVKKITLEAFQYGYSPNPVVVKKGDIVKLVVTSRDVTHGFSIKEYGIDMTAEKGKMKKVEFVANKEGRFNIICSVDCGPGHLNMKGTLVVEAK